MEQFQFDFEGFLVSEDPAVWTPRDIWTRLNQRVLEYFREDRRLERKGTKKADLDDLATYYSTFSNTPDGGLIVYGIEDKTGKVIGCKGFTTAQLNSIESSHVQRCPQAKPEFKRVPVVVDGNPTFCFAIFIPYVGKLVETNKGEAWIRYGESRRNMSEEEKRDFRATRQELSFELEVATTYKYPQDFDLHVVQDFCDAFRARDGRSDGRDEWTNEDVLVDRHLARKNGKKYLLLNGLVLMAAKDPRKSVPGCRVRVQRFSEPEEGAGVKYSPVIDRFIEGNLVKIIREADELISTVIYDVTWLNPEGKFVTTPEYPRWAWFESLINACVHRSYNFSGTEITVKLFPDRMEIESPGGFIPPVSEKTIYTARAARNYHLMDALRYLGYVQMAREGTRRIRESMNDFQLPDPVFKQEAVHGVVVRVTLMNDHQTRKRATNADVAKHFGVEVWKNLQEHEVKIAAYAYSNNMIQVSEAQRLTGRTWATSKKDLDRLTAKGILIFQPGAYPRDPKASYRIAVKKEGNGNTQTNGKAS